MDTADEYLKSEQSDCLKILDWIEDQSWSNGRVGMMGISWGGFNFFKLRHKAPQLKAIITCCSTDDRYFDDIHYKGGLFSTKTASAAFQHYLSSLPTLSLGLHGKTIGKKGLKNSRSLQTSVRATLKE